jgi:hypothetical protein
MTALGISFVIAIIPPIIGAVFVPETLGMRQIDFNEEKKEEKLQSAVSMEIEEEVSSYGYVVTSFSGEGPKRGTGQGEGEGGNDGIMI